MMARHSRDISHRRKVKNIKEIENWQQQRCSTISGTQATKNMSDGKDDDRNNRGARKVILLWKTPVKALKPIAAGTSATALYTTAAANVSGNTTAA